MQKRFCLWVLISVGLSGLFCPLADASDRESTFIDCARVLALRGNPEIDITVVSERHAHPEEKLGLIARANAGEIYLFLEGDPFREDHASVLTVPSGPVPIQVKKNGPVFGIENKDIILATEMFNQMLQVGGASLHPEVRRNRGLFFRDQRATSIWLGFVSRLQNQPAYWGRIRNTPLGKSQAGKMIEQMLELKTINATIQMIGQRQLFPDVDEFAQLIERVGSLALDDLVGGRPSLKAWVTPVRAVLSRKFTEADVLDAVANLNAIREASNSENMGRFLMDDSLPYRPIYIVMGAMHEELISVLEEDFAGVPNLRIHRQWSSAGVDATSRQIMEHRRGLRPR